MEIVHLAPWNTIEVPGAFFGHVLIKNVFKYELLLPNKRFLAFINHFLDNTRRSSFKFVSINEFLQEIISIPHAIHIVAKAHETPLLLILVSLGEMDEQSVACYSATSALAAAVASSIAARRSLTAASSSAVAVRPTVSSHASAASSSLAISGSASRQTRHAAGVHWPGDLPVLVSLAAANTSAKVVVFVIGNLSLTTGC
jgi:hypothetical protein